ncbi:MAG: tRNA (adenosine(37)-N6)-threonylcarbamoyltransferase complex ATPase subunit type 1 TsaE [Marinilabiliales bacterium]|nr:MAG: tRNA (adenosine(37)-N6)-threonylcarbamoyltransferase complex ATPase subunit type 1 TsaE [Marinilabiliales bacterium]
MVFSVEFDLNSIDEAAAGLKEAFPGARIFAFYGEMGSGKTTFIKALCRILGVEQTVTSPTFALVNEYRDGSGNVSCYHFDFYRIENLEEVLDMGYEEYFFGNDTCLIEWPEKIGGLLPPGTVRLELEVLDDGRRRLRETLFAATGKKI